MFLRLSNSVQNGGHLGFIHHGWCLIYLEYLQKILVTILTKFHENRFIRLATME
jgi:predicted alpha/beta-fold hydrolase